MSIRRDLDFQPEKNGPRHGDGKAMWGWVTVRGVVTKVATNPKTGQPLASTLRRLGAAPAVTGYQAGGLWREFSDTNPYKRRRLERDDRQRRQRRQRAGTVVTARVTTRGSAREQSGSSTDEEQWGTWRDEGQHGRGTVGARNSGDSTDEEQ